MARAFPKHLIGPSEDVIFDLNPHWLRFAMMTAPAVVVAVGGSILAFVLTGESSGLDKGQAVWICLALFALAGLWTFAQYLIWSHTHFVLTDHRVVVRIGVVSKSSTEIPLNRINSVSCSQNLFERIVHVGDLFIESASIDGRNVITDVRNPEAVRLLVAEHSANASNAMRHRDIHGVGIAPTPDPVPGSAASAPPAHVVEPFAEDDIATQLRSLSELCEAGIITDAEFAVKKAELLARM